MGLGAQLTAWHPDFKAALVARGFFVVSFDNRDVGLSTWLDEAGAADLIAGLSGTATAPYLLSDMAADATAVLDAEGIDSAHVVGASMGGMIAQTLAIEHPGRLRSLTSIMSTTGAPAVGQPHPGVIEVLLTPPPGERAARIDQSVRGARAISSPGYPFDEARARARAEADYDRAYHPEGTARQAFAILASGDRTEALGQVQVPTLVVHGDADPLVDVSGGRATAAAIPGAELTIFPGMGHDLPPALHVPVADAIAALAGTPRA
ncbi:alpha/beta fold hydrolase [Acidiferrimicrobium sp. IK]|nr:alpha/beta fold hydrolase [Acidiferrimicrobium sp. IK]